MDYVKIFADQLLPWLAIFLTTFLSILGKIVLDKLREKFSIDISEANERRMLGIISSGVHFGEEYGRKWAKDVKVDTTGEARFKQAMDFIHAEAERAGMSDWVEARGDDLGKLIEAALNKERQKGLDRVPDDEHVQPDSGEDAEA